MNFLAVMFLSPFVYITLPPWHHSHLDSDDHKQTANFSQLNIKNRATYPCENESQIQKKEKILIFLSQRNFEQEIFNTLINNNDFWEEKSSFDSSHIIKEMNIVANHIKKIIYSPKIRAKHVFETDLIFSENFNLSLHSFEVFLKIPCSHIETAKGINWEAMIKSAHKNINNKKTKNLKSWSKKYWVTEFEKNIAISYVKLNHINMAHIYDPNIIRDIQKTVNTKVNLLCAAEIAIEKIKNGRTRWILELINIHNQLNKDTVEEYQFSEHPLNLKKKSPRYSLIQKDIQSILNRFENQNDFSQDDNTSKNNIDIIDSISKKLHSTFDISYNNINRKCNILKKLKSFNVQITPLIKKEVKKMLNEQENDDVIISKIHLDFIDERKQKEIQKENRKLQKAIKKNSAEKKNHLEMLEKEFITLERDIFIDTVEYY
ncbi:MAG: hypothetical protein AB8C84_06400 [Oligoflexales bacterium]